MPKKEISQRCTADIVNQGTNEDVFGTSQKRFKCSNCFLTQSLKDD